MVIKKIKSTQTTTQSATLSRNNERSQSTIKRSAGRILLGLVLLCVNICAWSYFAYQIYTLREEHLYAQRARIQQANALRREKARKAQELALDTVALIDGNPITLTEVRELAAGMPPLAEMSFEEVYPNLLDMIINNQVVMIAAQKAGVLERPEIKTQLRLAKEQIVGQTYLEELLAAHVTEEELKHFYDEELKNFKREEEIHARHILLKTEKEARDILVQLKAGANFIELANKKSLDENTKDGDLGYFTKAMMIPEFGDAVFDMKKGQLSEPIKTPFGWHIVLVEDKRLANPPAFEDIREDILRAAMETKLPMVLDEERAKLKVQILRPTLDTAP